MPVRISADVLYSQALPCGIRIRYNIVGGHRDLQEKASECSSEEQGGA